MRKGKIVGFKKFVSKNGNNMCVISITFDYTDKEKESMGATGQDTYSGFVPRGYDIDSINKDVIGKEADVSFSFYNNQQNLVYLNIAK